MVAPRSRSAVDEAALADSSRNADRPGLCTTFKLRRAGEPTDRNAEHVILPPPKGDPKSPEWRPYVFARDQWHCRICGDRFQYSETVRKHIADAHDENVPPSMYEYFRGAVWQRKKIP